MDTKETIVMKGKTLITAGCSFTQTEIPSMNFTRDNWPKHLSDRNYAELINYGMFATGNEMIARTIIHGVSKSLKDNKDIVVGVMWSGKERHTVYSDTATRPGKGNFPYGPRRFIKEPIDVLHPNAVSPSTGGWLDMSASGLTVPEHPWHDLIKNWYSVFSNKAYSEIRTLENILMVQNYLELNNIDYFMCGYMDDVMSFNLNENTTYLHDLIDWSKCIKTGMLEWCESRNYLISKEDKHPSDIGSLEYTKQIIETHLTERDLI
jgi:hypothetical protein